MIDIIDSFNCLCRLHTALSGGTHLHVSFLITRTNMVDQLQKRVHASERKRKGKKRERESNGKKQSEIKKASETEFMEKHKTDVKSRIQL